MSDEQTPGEPVAWEIPKALRDKWRREKGNGMTSAVGEYTPSEFWRLLDSYEALLAHPRPRVGVTTPVRKLREYKGVTYDPMQGQYVNGGLWRFDGSDYETVALLIHQNDFDFTDADHAAIYALRDDPYKPVETVEDIVRDVVRCGTMDFIDSYATRLRAAVAAEGVRDA